MAGVGAGVAMDGDPAGVGGGGVCQQWHTVIPVKLLLNLLTVSSSIGQEEAMVVSHCLMCVRSPPRETRQIKNIVVFQI